MKYYLWISGKEEGPFTIEQIQRFIDNGDITNRETARAENSLEWNALNRIARLPLKITPASIGVCVFFGVIGALLITAGFVSLNSFSSQLRRSLGQNDNFAIVCFIVGLPILLGSLIDGFNRFNKRTISGSTPSTVETPEFRLQRLSNLQKDGLITAEEYEKRRDEILRLL